MVLRKPENSVDLLEVGLVEDCPVEEDGRAGSSLGVPREFSSPVRHMEGEVRVAVDVHRQPGWFPQCTSKGFHHPSIGRIQPGQRSVRSDGQCDAIGQASGSLDHRAASRASTQDRNVVLDTPLHLHGLFDSLSVSYHNEHGC